MRLRRPSEGTVAVVGFSVVGALVMAMILALGAQAKSVADDDWSEPTTTTTTFPTNVREVGEAPWQYGPSLYAMCDEQTGNLLYFTSDEDAALAAVPGGCLEEVAP